MTDKQIIIDGYNLEYIKELLYNGQRSAISTKTFEAIIETLENKEQECERLKENLPNAITRLMKQLDQLKAENEELKGIRDRNFLHALEEQKRADKYFKTLTEIKVFLEYEFYGENIWVKEKILQKISEVVE